MRFVIAIAEFGQVPGRNLKLVKNLFCERSMFQSGSIFHYKQSQLWLILLVTFPYVHLRVFYSMLNGVLTLYFTSVHCPVPHVKYHGTMVDSTGYDIATGGLGLDNNFSECRRPKLVYCCTYHTFKCVAFNLDRLYKNHAIDHTVVFCIAHWQRMM